MITNEVSGWIVGKGLVHGAVETARFVDIAVQGIRIVAESGHCVYVRSVTPFPSIATGQRCNCIIRRNLLLKWFAWPCMGPRPLTCQKSW